MAFIYQDDKLGVFKADGSFKSISEIIGAYKGPTYIYDLDEVKKRIQILQNGFNNSVSIHYAMKSNHNPELLKIIKECGAGVDTVSAGEVKIAIETGINPSNIVLSGVGKTVSELSYVIDLGIKQINVESPQELQRIGEIAKDQRKVAKVAFRYNPDVDPNTHPYIKTGFRDNKFGMDNGFGPELEKILVNFKDSIELVGITLHIGSQLRNIEEFKEAIRKTKPVWDHFNNLGFNLKTLDIGGGLGINYESDNFEEDYEMMRNYCREMLDVTSSFEAELLIEPGRIVSARAGVLISEVQYIKKTQYKNFAIVDTGMHHLLRPSLYKAFHRIVPIEKQQKQTIVYDVVGPICESSDVVGYDRPLPEISQGDLLAICDAGAYGFSMASLYNVHALPNEIVC